MQVYVYMSFDLRQAACLSIVSTWCEAFSFGIIVCVLRDCILRDEYRENQISNKSVLLSNLIIIFMVRNIILRVSGVRQTTQGGSSTKFPRMYFDTRFLLTTYMK